MPAYATYAQPADVIAELKNITVSATTILTTTYLQEYLDQEQAGMDGKLGLRYVLPITQAASPQSFLVLQKILAKLTAGRADKILRRVGVNTNPDEIKKIQTLLCDGESLMDAVMELKTILLDAVMQTPITGVLSGSEVDQTALGQSSIGVNVITTGQSAGFVSMNQADSNGRVFQKGKVMW